jgi:hypothetical protein
VKEAELDEVREGLSLACLVWRERVVFVQGKGKSMNLSFRRISCQVSKLLPLLPTLLISLYHLKFPPV